MTTSLGQSGDMVVDQILSHRLNEDKCKYEYNVKMKNKQSMPWVAEEFLNKFHKDILNSYKLANKLNDTISETSIVPCQEEENAETNEANYSKWLAINFNKDVGIKCEICVSNNEVNTLAFETNGIDSMSSSIPISKEMEIKNECVEPVVNQIKINNSQSNGIKVIKDQSNEINATVNNSYTSHKSKLSSSRTKEPSKSVQDTAPTQISEQQKLALFAEEYLENGVESMDEILSQLPLAAKIQIDARDIKTMNPITSDLLKMIIDRSDIDLLQAYVFSEHKSLLMSLIQVKPSLVVQAAMKGDVHIVATLLSLGANINATDSNLDTALMHACYNENEVLIDLLVNNGAAMNMKHNGSNDVMFQCLSRNKPRAVSTLLNLGANFTEIYLRPPFSLVGFAKQLKNDEIHNIVENHISSLSKKVHELVAGHLGSNVKIMRSLMPIQVFSTNEINGEKIRIVFNVPNVPQISANRFNMLFPLSGFVLGNSVKLMITDFNKITSVILNDVEQHCLTPDSNTTVTTFDSLKADENILNIHFMPTFCRKLRLILVAYDVIIME